MDEPKSLADILAQSGNWEKFKNKLNKAVGVGLGRWVLGPGSPERVFNPFRALANPGATYSPENYQGIGKMGQRLRLTEDESSPPMKALRTAVTKNPLLEGLRVKVQDPGTPGGLGAGAGGSMAWEEKGPVVRLAPNVSPTADPGFTAVHEVVGHGSHGLVSGSTQEIQENVVRPRVEGLAVGAEKGIYGPLGLALPSAYETKYGNRPEYREAQSLGERVAQHLAETGEVVPQEAVVGGLFRGGNPLPLKKPTPSGGGS